MAFANTPRSWTTGELVTASFMNGLRDALNETAPAILTTAGDMLYATSGTVRARLGIGATNKLMTVVAGLPSWTFDPETALAITLGRRTTAAAGQSTTVQAGGAQSGGTNLAGGALILSGGIATGSGQSSIEFWLTRPGAGGSADRNPTKEWSIVPDALLPNGGFNIGSASARVFTLYATNLDAASYVSIGSTPATSGAIRVPNGESILFRNAANSANRTLIQSDASNNVIVGDVSGVNDVRLYYSASGAVRFFDGVADRMVLGDGLTLGPPSGGDKGFGTINAIAVYDDNVLLTDFVYEPDYKYLTVPEMAAFFRREKHLPTIPGRAEWERLQGFSVGKLATHLWETVEVQAIYIAELYDRIETLSRPTRAAGRRGV